MDIEALPESVRRRIEISPDGHWLWLGHINRLGYGQAGDTWFGKRMWPAHRLVWVLSGKELSENLHHECRVRRCVNPSHLTALAASAHATLHHPQKSHCIHGHALTGANVYIRKDNGQRMCKRCMADRGNERHRRRTPEEKKAKSARSVEVRRARLACMTEDERRAWNRRNNGGSDEDR